MITPAISVMSAIEGLEARLRAAPIVPLSILVLTLLFAIQSTVPAAKSASCSLSTMLLWFIVCGGAGHFCIISNRKCCRR